MVTHWHWRLWQVIVVFTDSSSLFQMDVIEQERQIAAAEKQMNSMLEECMILFEAVSWSVVLMNEGLCQGFH